MVGYLITLMLSHLELFLCMLRHAFSCVNCVVLYVVQILSIECGHMSHFRHLLHKIVFQMYGGVFPLICTLRVLSYMLFLLTEKLFFILLRFLQVIKRVNSFLKNNNITKTFFSTVFTVYSILIHSDDITRRVVMFP